LDDTARRDAEVVRESEAPEMEAGHDTPKMEAGHDKATGTGEIRKEEGDFVWKT
jgi:hypothetical protein